MEKLFRDQWRAIRLARLSCGVIFLVVDEGKSQSIPWGVWGGQWLCEPDSCALDIHGWR